MSDHSDRLVYLGVYQDGRSVACWVIPEGMDANAVRRQIEALPLLVAALSALVEAAPTVLSCDDFHHPKADQGHGYGLDDCGPRNRYFAAIEAADRALAALRGDDAAEGGE